MAAIAKVNLVIVSERAGCFHYVGDNLASVADPEQRIVLSSIRGEGAGAIESHFERLMPLVDVRPTRGLCTGLSQEFHSHDDNAAASIVRARPMNEYGRGPAQQVRAETRNRKVECSPMQKLASAMARSSEVARDQSQNPAQPDFVDNLLEEFENSVRQDCDAELEAFSAGERPPGLDVGDLAHFTSLHLAPDWLQFDPRMGPRWANIGPQLAPSWHGLAQLGPKLFQHWPKIGAPVPGRV